MRRLIRRIKRMQGLMAFICVPLSLVLSVSCFRFREKRQYIEPLGLYFQVQPADTIVTISFGEKADSIYPNYFETWHVNDGGSPGVYFIVDNTSGSPNVRHIFFSPRTLFDIHIPDYSYSVDPYSWIVKIGNFRHYVRKLKKITDNSISDKDYYVVAVYQGDYDRGVDYFTYDLGELDDMDTFLEPFIKNASVISYPDLGGAGVQRGFLENVAIHGDPMASKRLTVTETNRKDMINAGWLFLDTMDIRQGPVLEIDKWKAEDNIVSIIYRIGSDGDRIPINGARYPYAMEIHRFKVYYQ